GSGLGTGNQVPVPRIIGRGNARHNASSPRETRTTQPRSVREALSVADSRALPDGFLSQVDLNTRGGKVHRPFLPSVTGTSAAGDGLRQDQFYARGPAASYLDALRGGDGFAASHCLGFQRVVVRLARVQGWRDKRSARGPGSGRRVVDGQSSVD